MKTKFKELQTTRKGYAGEAIVKRLLEKKGLIVYECMQDRGHLVDFICCLPGRPFFAVEVKTKPRKAFTQTTGIDTADFKKYVRLAERHNIDTVLFFVDSFEQAIYSAKISELRDLSEPEGFITYFSLDSMKFQKKLIRAELNALLRVGDYDHEMYKNTKRYFA